MVMTTITIILTMNITTTTIITTMARMRHGVTSHGDGPIDFGAGLAGVHVPGLSQERIVQIERDILSQERRLRARKTARASRRNGMFALNFVSSPGSGKTTLLVRTITDLKERFPIAVIEGDQQTSNDAERIRATGAPAIQINTGKGCHLDAHMVGHALDTARAAQRRRCCSSRMSAIWSVPPPSISARRTRWWCCRSPRARTSRSNIPTCSPPPI